MTNQQACIFIMGIGIIFLVIPFILFIWDKNRRKKYTETAIGTVIDHHWGHTEHASYPYPILSYNVNGVDYKRRLTYSSVSYNNIKHAKADWSLDEKYGLHIYTTRKCTHHINPIDDWFPLGSTLPIYYIPNKPWKSYCGALMNIKLAGIIMGSIGVLITLLGILLHVVL